MRNSTTPIQPTSIKQTTTVFTSGNSQAVRLPKEFRFNSKTVEISRRGNEIVLRERPLMVGDVIGKFPPINGLPDDVEDYLSNDVPNMEGIA